MEILINLKENDYISYVGHETTAQIITNLLETEVIMDRTPYEQKTGEQALVFKLNGRAPEGRILNMCRK